MNLSNAKLINHPNEITKQKDMLQCLQKVTNEKANFLQKPWHDEKSLNYRSFAIPYRKIMLQKIGRIIAMFVAENLQINPTVVVYDEFEGRMFNTVERAETIIFHMAKSLSEYENESTLPSRVGNVMSTFQEVKQINMTQEFQKDRNPIFRMMILKSRRIDDLFTHEHYLSTPDFDGQFVVVSMFTWNRNYHHHYHNKKPTVTLLDMFVGL